MPKARTAKGYVLEPLPDLRRGPDSTKSNALHPIRFDGWLAPWDGFIPSVARTFENRTWGTQIIDYLPQMGPKPSLNEHVQVGDEPGVQSRFSDRVEQPLSIVASCEGMGFFFGDSKSFLSDYKKVPDFLIIKSPNTSIAVVGELKVPWVKHHKLGQNILLAERMGGSEDNLRICLGQIAQYMQDLGLKYGILTTYNETIFVRQRGSVTLRQAILHVALLGLAG
ncbi:hypothetical protein PENDEC_c005G05172 [Penicillium decumbens]|uniref:Uncharacterized protein n=1 Tax=Penicillium decumbens TaxID=69771 RepID=A0A1V6PHK8_PENDC|nr:hypothetical protein PENDEC_c005G05172 [Penicillium decumbens]